MVGSGHCSTLVLHSCESLVSRKRNKTAEECFEIMPLQNKTFKYTFIKYFAKNNYSCRQTFSTLVEDKVSHPAGAIAK